MRGFARITLLLALALGLASSGAFAAKINDIANTKHNLSSTGPGTVKATSETQICVFCHTPHAAQNIPKAPLWNRALSAVATYTTYTSDSLKSTPGQPENSSKLCLSCHDGTMALGQVGVANGLANVSIAGVDAATMPAGSGTTTGYTRHLGGAAGSDLTNDHPISFTYDTALATANGELRDPATNTYIATRVQNNPTRPAVPLESGKMQCIACHDPHIRDSDMAKNAKFLRLNRLQEAAPGGGAFSVTNDQICLGCHDKAGWSGSAHANSAVATQTYTAAATTQREFPANLPVWQAGCLNCHDTHTVQGARRLLREGTDSAVSPKAGGNPALEETCYQCHDGGTTVIGNTPTAAPNIKTDFSLAIHMPIKSTEQAAGSEVHAITDKDFTESQLKLGLAAPSNRHAECTDCHNPHRVIKNRLFNTNPATADAAGTHEHTAGVAHTNLASGVLAGTTGVEPVYGATVAWGTLPTSYDLKKGYGGVGASTAAGSTWVTREYQICLKCHSDYAYGASAPLLTNTPSGGTPSGTNGMTQFTNQGMELLAPSNDQGEATNNHRSWHPVLKETGRTTAVRWNMNANNFTAPWNAAVGSQTMYCSDCHGSDTGVGSASVVPTGGENGNPWGPHGSSNNFILKGAWNQDNPGATDANIKAAMEICYKCHDYNAYSNLANATDAASANFKSGFGSVASTAMGCTITATLSANNLHLGHRTRIGKELRCTWCHAAVPHGWKNKALLVDITTDSTCAGVEPCNQAPYYRNAMLGGGGAVVWQKSGQWAHDNCGGANGFASWMGGTCNNPP